MVVGRASEIRRIFMDRASVWGNSARREKEENDSEPCEAVTLAGARTNDSSYSLVPSMRPL